MVEGVTKCRKKEDVVEAQAMIKGGEADTTFTGHHFSLDTTHTGHHTKNKQN